MELKHVVLYHEDVNPLVATSYDVIARFRVVEDVTRAGALSIVPSWTDRTTFRSPLLAM